MRALYITVLLCYYYYFVFKQGCNCQISLGGGSKFWLLKSVHTVSALCTSVYSIHYNIVWEFVCGGSTGGLKSTPPAFFKIAAGGSEIFAGGSTPPTPRQIQPWGRLRGIHILGALTFFLNSCPAWSKSGPGLDKINGSAKTTELR